MITLLLALVVTFQDVQEVGSFETEGQAVVGFSVAGPDEGMREDGSTDREFLAAEISWDIELGSADSYAGLVARVCGDEGQCDYSGLPGEGISPGEGRVFYNDQIEDAEYYRYVFLHSALRLEILAPPPTGPDATGNGRLVVLGGTITTIYQYEDGLPETDPTPEVPEPATALLLGLGLAAVRLVATRRSTGWMPTPDVPGQAAGRFSR